MKIFLVDGTYELFRHYFAVPSHLTKDFHEVGAVRGVLTSMLGLIESGCRYLGVATDHVIESFRNELYPGYKTGEGIDPQLLAQFQLLEDALVAMGVHVWPMVDLEADDALASAAVVVAEYDNVDQVVIMTPDKDLAQCVRGAYVVQVDRRRNVVYDDDGVKAKFGVPPLSIPDYLALVGDAADGYPGLQGWGAKSTATVVREYGSIEAIPDDVLQWTISVRGASSLASCLASRREDAMLFKTLATLRVDRSLLSNIDQLRWEGPVPAFRSMCELLEAEGLWERANRLAADVNRLT